MKKVAKKTPKTSPKKTPKTSMLPGIQWPSSWAANEGWPQPSDVAPDGRTFGEIDDELREKHGVSLEQLAREMGKATNRKGGARRIGRDGMIYWHPMMRGAERMSEDRLETALGSLPFGGCTLRAAAAGGLTMREVGVVMVTSRQAIEQIEGPALVKFERAMRRKVS